MGLRPSDGAPATKLGEGSAKAISPDGSWVLAQRQSPGAPLQLLPAGAGRGRINPVGDVEVGAARWLPDGGRIFCTGRAADGPVLQAGELIIAFSTDANWLFVEWWAAQSVEVDRVHIGDGKRKPWKAWSPRDTSGVVLVFGARVALDGDT